PFRIAVLFEPVGVDQARRVLVRGLDDGAQKRLLLSGMAGPLPHRPAALRRACELEQPDVPGAGNEQVISPVTAEAGHRPRRRGGDMVDRLADRPADVTDEEAVAVAHRRLAQRLLGRQRRPDEGAARATRAVHRVAGAAPAEAALGRAQALRPALKGQLFPQFGFWEE